MVFNLVSGTKPIDAGSREFISSEITRGVKDWTLVVFGSAKEGILEILDSHLGAFRADVVLGKLGALLETKACESLESFRKEDPIVSSCHHINSFGLYREFVLHWNFASLG